MTNTIKGVEIFATGTWNGHMIKVDDLVQMARNQQTLASKLRIPLKFGHNEEQAMTDGQPALGWVTRLRIIGNKLLADFEDVPEIVFQAIKSGRYDRVSSEVMFGVKLGEEEIGSVLIGVALLGADLPAVSDLEGLSKLVASLQILPGEAAVFSFSAGDEVSKLEDQEGAKPKQEDDDMKDELEKLQGTVADLSASMQTLKGNADAEKLRADNATKELDAFKKLEEQKEVASTAELFVASRKNIMDQCESLVKDGKLTPALRDKIEVAIKTGEANFSSNGKAILFDSELVMETIKAFSGTIPDGEEGQGDGQNQGKGDEIVGEKTGDELERLFKAYALENKLNIRDNQDYQAITSAVLDDPKNLELVKAYNAFNSSLTAN